MRQKDFCAQAIFKTLSHTDFNPNLMSIRDYFQTRWLEARSRFMLVLVWIGVLWAVHIVDWMLPDTFLELKQLGIRPRELAGLPGIAAAPFLHVDIWHLLMNTIPLAVLGWVLVMSGRGLFLRVCMVTAVSSGVGAWLFGESGRVHEGISGVIYGLQAFLMARGWFARRLSWTLIALVVTVLYTGIIFGLLKPDPGISWSSHFWGFCGGLGYAWWLYGRDEYWRRQQGAPQPALSRPPVKSTAQKPAVKSFRNP